MRLFVPLTRDELDALRRLAEAERRQPQDQAAALIARGLADRGLPPALPPSPTEPAAHPAEGSDDGPA